MTTSLGTRVRELAAQHPHDPALTDDDGTLSWRQLDHWTTQLARALATAGVALGDLVSVVVPSDRRALATAVAAWKLGATPQLLSPRMPAAELEAVLEVSRPAVVVGMVDVPGISVWRAWDTVAQESTDPLPDAVSPSWKAPTSGGSTGRPKVILSTTPGLTDRVTAMAGALRLAPDDVVLIPVPMHHNGPFHVASTALATGCHVVVHRRFDPARLLHDVPAWRATWLYAVPTVLSRTAKLEQGLPAPADLSSLRTVFHMAAPCPAWLKHWWIDRLSPDAVWELYGGTEAQAVTVIGGREWLEHPGSVGQAVAGQVRVVTADGSPAGPGVVGEVLVRADGDPTYRYLGAAPDRREDGWECLGDLGWTDEDGFLHLADRATDMVLVGGANVYPAEVEAALEAHPSVVSCAVIGLPDDDLGNRLHALVQTAVDVSDEALGAFLAERLSPYKRPRTYERVASPLRDEAGKVRRSQLRAERLVPAG